MSGTQKKTHYIQADMHRILCRKETCLAILGVAAALFFSVGNVQDFEGSVIQTFLFATYNVGFLLSFVFCALPYGTAYCEELENHYIRYSVIRGNLRNYVASKTVTIFFSAVSVMTLGCILFALLLSCFSSLPWLDGNTYESIVRHSGYLPLASQKQYIAWVGAYGLQWGIYAGCLALAASYASLYISNRLLVLAMPALVHQAIVELGTDTFRQYAPFDPLVVFNAQYHLFGSDWKMLSWAFGIGAGLSAAIGAASYFRMKKRM